MAVPGRERLARLSRHRWPPPAVASCRSGLFTGTVTSLGKDDFRQHNPRFGGENLASNRGRFMPFMALEKEAGVTPAQLALA
jgi:aryl-alcohol dehydrogenase-like predicted oxidoreductase